MQLFPTRMQGDIRAIYLVRYDGDWFLLWIWFNGDPTFLEHPPSVISNASLPMGRDFVALARALRWAGPGSLGRVHCGASWAGSGRGSTKPGLPNQPGECFVSYLVFLRF